MGFLCTKMICMRRKTLFVVLSIFTLFLSVLWHVCLHDKFILSDENIIQGDSVRRYEEFPKNVFLNGCGFVIENELLRYPFRISQDDDYLYLLDLHGADFFCHVFCKSTMKHFASFAKRGNGPGEVLQAMDMYVISKDSIFLYDTDNREITLWGYSEFDKAINLKETYRMKSEMLLSANCTWQCDSVYYFTDKSGENRILKCNKNGDIIEKIGKIPTKQNKYGKVSGILAQAWNSYIKYSPKKQILVVATQLGDVIEIYNFKEGTRNVLYGQQGEPVYEITPNGFAIPTGIMGFSDIQITDKYIYTVFHGRAFKDIIKDPNNTLDGGEYIHIYNLNGEPICRLILDHAIYGIDVDEKNGIIWATDVNSEDQIVVYKLPEFLFN